MANPTSAIIIDRKTAASLSEEMGRIASALTKVSQRLAKLSTEAGVSVVEIDKSTDPDMFTDEFIKTVRKSRREFEQGEYLDYREFRKTLNL